MNKQINIKELLDWYIMAGVSETCGDLPCLSTENNTKNESGNKEPSPNITEPQRIKNNNFVSIALKNAKEECEKATTLDELKEILIKFDGCTLKNTAASTVLGEGCENAKIMLIGEAPGADEDKLGRPFVGRCGKLLDKMLESINIKREECYITNILPWRPPGNRTPTDEELSLCLPFLEKQIEIIKPDFILLLGKIAFKSVMDNPESISRVRGKWFEYNTENGKNIHVLATFHPSYLLRSSNQKAKVWIDLLRLKSKIAEKE
ncbi:MAG: uracil-DNA glycosylase [Alphaproteobacteria bacterium]|nr:uracil-DNA glycosylase [Alphaproteobacteria bacterium]